MKKVEEIPGIITRSGVKYKLVDVLDNGDGTYDARYQAILPAILQKQAH